MTGSKYPSYRRSKVYLEASKSMKREIESYVRENNPENDAMYLQLRRYELKNDDKNKQRTPGNLFSFVISTAAILFYFVLKNEMAGSSNPVLLMIMVIIMLALCLGYYSGRFSKSKAEIRKIERELMKFDRLPEFDAAGNKNSKSK